MANEQTSSLQELPNDIISLILSRLPSKIVALFKSVSKTWNSIITPQFIRSYITNHSPSWLLIMDAIEFDNKSLEDITLSLPIVNPPNTNIFSVNPQLLLTTNQVIHHKIPGLILTSSNGLILFSITIEADPLKKYPGRFYPRDFEHILFVGSPITREWIPLPSPVPTIDVQRAVGFITRLSSYPGVVEKFLVVEYQLIVTDENPVIIAVLMCYSSDTNQWVQIMTDYSLGMHLWRHDGVFEFANRLVWFDLSVGITVWDEDPFDFMVSNKTKALCRFISLPKECGRLHNSNDPKLLENRSIYGNGGFMQYTEVFEGGDNVLKVWRLMGFGLAEEMWTLRYNVTRVDFQSCGLGNSLPRVMFGHPLEADVVFLFMGKTIFSYNFQSRNADNVGVYKFIVPVVIPSWPTSLALPIRNFESKAYEQEDNLENKAC